MKRTIRVADYDTQREIKFSVEGNASKLDSITTFLKSGGVLSNPDYGLEAIKAGINEAKKSVSDGKAKVAAAIAAKGIQTAADSTFDTLASNIGKIVTLSSGSADANATAAQILSGYSAYVKGVKVNGSIKSLGAQTITPGTAAKTIAANQYLSGVQTIAGDANLVAGNIVKGKSIFGVAGNASGDLSFRAVDTSTYKRFDVNENLRVVRFTPYSEEVTITTPGGSSKVTLKLNQYGAGTDMNNRKMLFVPSETIRNVVGIKCLTCAHTSSTNYTYFRTEPQFVWNDPSFTKKVVISTGSTPTEKTFNGENRLGIYFPNPSANGEYGGIAINEVEAYCY